MIDSERLQRLDHVLEQYVTDSKLPGYSLLVSRNGSVAHRSLGGLRDVEAGEPVRDDTIFRIYSMTKPITSVAVMMLFEQGAFELTDPVSKFLPEFADVRVWDGGSDLRPVTVPATEPIRIWHLLTHTSGLTYGFHHAHPVDALYRKAGYEWGAPRDVDLAGAVRAYASMPLLFQPGREWNYSVATDVLGRLVEVVAKAPLDEALHAMVLEPLGMRDTFFRLPDDRRDRLAALYLPRPGGGLVRNDTMGEGVVNPWWFSGGGGLSSTVDDYHRFTQFLLGRGELDGTRLLGDRTARYMTRNHLPGGVDLKAFGRPLFAESPFDGVGFGLGFAVNLDPVATHTLGSAGEFNWGGAASTSFWVDPAEDLTVVFMTQLLPSSTYPLRSQLRQLVYSALVDRRD
ncbi:serine hydrolase [Jatrophihabitans endophyticus]|uniref:serine hydrolase domain-containing protein n=1 Tax=Jatrophihabitans endophyticus TaxID=1206085 RepID=UPI001A1033BD|nr:serine hydrolase domain-containing protein [Jatrophihabitans endophyticus]MBE7187359.1 beta-lactamase family protein [Jatrophihabitans endophyticus]